MSEGAAETVTVVDADGVRTITITIDRPEARNAMTVAMRERLVEVFTSTSNDDAVDIVVITGADPSFSAGADLKQIRSATGPPKRVNPPLHCEPARSRRSRR